jgi:phage shock protein A
MLEGDLDTARKELAKAQSELRENIKSIEEAKQPLVAELDRQRRLSNELKASIGQAKSAKEVETEERLKAEKEKNSQLIQSLNNQLQSANSAIADEKKRVRKFEEQVLKLSNDLNVERARAAKAPVSATNPQSFAEAASAAGSANVNLVNTAYKHLSKRAKEILHQERHEVPSEDVRDRTFRLVGALNTCTSAVYKPYKLVLGGLYDDLKVMSWEARLKFLPLINAIDESLTPAGHPLTEDEINAKLDGTDREKLLLAPRLRKPGFKTFADYTRVEEENRAKSKGKEKLQTIAPNPMDEKEFPGIGPDDLPEPDEDDSLYKKARRWLKNHKRGLNARLREKLARSKERTIRLYKLVHGNFFQRAFSHIYKWWCTLW